MRVLKVILLVLDAIVMFVVGAFIGAMIALPNERSFTNEIEIRAPAEIVWNVISDRGHFAEWQGDLSKLEIVDDTHWIEYPVNSPEPLNFSLVEDDRPLSMTFEYTMGDSFRGKWVGILDQAPDGVRLRTRDSYVSSSRPAKVVIAMFFDMDGFAKRWNASLKRRAESLIQ